MTLMPYDCQMRCISSAYSRIGDSQSVVLQFSFSLMGFLNSEYSFKSYPFFRGNPLGARLFPGLLPEYRLFYWNSVHYSRAGVRGRSRSLGRFTVPFLALPASIPDERYSQDLGVRPEVQSPVGLIAVQNAVRLEDAVLILTFFYAQELPVLPIRIDERRRRLAGPGNDLLHFLLLCIPCRTKVDAAMKSSD